jgi:UDP-GlcNAc:undecaprenyl-phosphate GlcNAc-1-phosphate transferase
LAAIVAVYLGDISIAEWSIWWHIYIIPQRLFVIFFVFWSVLCINALNWFDYANGQSSWVGAIGFLTIFLLIWLVVLPQYPNISIDHKYMLTMVQNLSFVLFILSGIGTVFEWRPIWLLRDVWTMFLWFWLAYLSVIGGAKIGTLIVALSLVIFDAIWVGIHRIFIIKSSPMQWDYRHIHHRLVRLGWTRGEVRWFVWVFSLVMMILMLLQAGNRTGKIIIFILMASIFFGVNAYLFWVKKLPCWLGKD